jgi:hypothetical protein
MYTCRFFSSSQEKYWKEFVTGAAQGSERGAQLFTT